MARPPDPRATNLALLALLAGAVVSGGLLFATGTGWALAVLVAHALIGLSIVLTATWKGWIVRRGMSARPTRSTWPSVVLAVLVVVTVASGVLHSSGAVLRYGPLDDMQVHVGAALGSLPFAAWHVVARRTFPAGRDLSRRNLLRGGLLLGSAGATFGALEVLYRAAGLPGGERRFTGSFEQGSHDPAAMPTTIWLFDPEPQLDPGEWSLEIVDARGRRRLTYDELPSRQDRRTATIDCTGGWFAEQDWHGVRLSRLVDVGTGDGSLLVRSTTGYARRFPLADVPDLLLATGYGDRPLAPGHGFPLRLVAPGRRGFWWVKWVTHVSVDATPWWAQPPFPLQ